MLLVLSGLEPCDASWWSSVGLRRALVECMQEALAVQGLQAPAPAEFALLRVGVSSLARAAAQSAKVQEKGPGRLKLAEEVQAVIEAADRKAVAMEHSQRKCPFRAASATLGGPLERQLPGKTVTPAAVR